MPFATGEIGAVFEMALSPRRIAYSVRDDESKRAGLLEGYGAIERADWQEMLRLYQF